MSAVFLFASYFILNAKTFCRFSCIFIAINRHDRLAKSLFIFRITLYALMQYDVFCESWHSNMTSNLDCKLQIALYWTKTREPVESVIPMNGLHRQVNVIVS